MVEVVLVVVDDEDKVREVAVVEGEGGVGGEGGGSGGAGIGGVGGCYLEVIMVVAMEVIYSCGVGGR